MTTQKYMAASKRAFSVFTIKDARGHTDGTITGMASTPETDRQGDVLIPEGAQFRLPLPLLWQHDHSQPIGHVTSARVSARGIEIVAKIAVGVSSAIDNAYRLIQAGLVQGLSVGFRTLEAEPIATGYRISRWELLELSAVTLPCNAAATITSVKAAFGVARSARDYGAIPLVDRKRGAVKLIQPGIRLVQPPVRLIQPKR